MNEKVDCYAGATYPERPRAFVWQGKRYQVAAVIQRRREPEGMGFLVRPQGESRLFDLFYNEEQHSWRISPKGTVE